MIEPNVPGSTHAPVDTEKSSAGDAEANESQLDAELAELVPVIDMLDRVGARVATGSARPGALGSELDAGGLLRDFHIIGVIGRGGMGVVYEAYQISLKRRVALKVLPTSSAEDPRKVNRFLVEARAAASLHHPHIVPVHLVGSQDGLHYFAMQFIKGNTLAELIANACPEHPIARISHRAAADLGAQAARALHFAHEQGIIHRDVKPSNLLVDASGWLWVGDFGLARVAGQADLTVSGTVLGTVRYMSPEQAFGGRSLVDHRTDVYSLGATLYELIVGRPAFDGDDRLDLLRRISREGPPPLRRVEPAVPRDLETIVLKALATDPADRYATALALADDLERFLQDRPIQARPPGAIDRMGKWAKRHRPAVAIGAAVMLAGVIGLCGLAVWRSELLRRHNTELASALERAGQNELTARRLLYDSRIRQAQQAFGAGQVELAQELLSGIGPTEGPSERLGFEWRYLHAICHREVSVLTDQETTAMMLGPDGRTLISGDAFGSVLFWDLRANRGRGSDSGHTRRVAGLACRPDGRLVASWPVGSGPLSEVKLWDPLTAGQLGTITSRMGSVAQAAFSADGRRLVILRHDVAGQASRNAAEIWDLAQGPDRAIRTAAPIECDTMALSRDGQWLATGVKTGGTVTLRDPATGRPVRSLSGRSPELNEILFSPDSRQTVAVHSSGLTFWDTRSAREIGSVSCRYTHDVQFSPDGDRLVGTWVTGDSIELVIDVRTHPRLVPLKGCTGTALHATFSPDGRMLATGGSSAPATLWDVSSGRKVAEFSEKTGPVGCLLFTSDGKSLIFKAEDGRIRSWHFAKRSDPIARLAGHEAEVWGLAFSRDGSTLFSSADDHAIKVWRTADGQLQATLKGHNALVASVAASPDGKWLASASFDKTIRLWSLDDLQTHIVLRGHTDRVRTVAFSPDGSILVSAGSDRTVRFWNVATGATTLVFERHKDAVRNLAFHPSGAYVASSGNDRSVRLINLADGREMMSLACPKEMSAVAFSPYGSLLAAGDDWGNIRTWDTAGWTARKAMKASDTAIWSLAFSPDGQTLAAACGDAKVRVWDPATGQMVLELSSHSQRVNAVVFSPDGSDLASASHDGSIRLWRANSGTGR